VYRNFRRSVLEPSALSNRVTQRSTSDRQSDSPHRRAQLAEGLTGGATIIDPLHDCAFTLRSGAVIGIDLRYAPSARLSEDGILLIEL
jgi:hypothetical protein